MIHHPLHLSKNFTYWPLEVKVNCFSHNMFLFHLHGARSCDNPIATKLANVTTKTILMLNKKESLGPVYMEWGTPV